MNMVEAGIQTSMESRKSGQAEGSQQDEAQRVSLGILGKSGKQEWVFPVVTQGCESWARKKDENQIIDALELWRWRRLLRVPWTVRRSNQLILKENDPEYSLEGLMLQLKL